MRNFEIVDKYKEYNVKIPKRASEHSAGYDFSVIENYLIKPGEIVLVKTGIRVEMPTYEVLLMYPRSSLAINKGLMMSNGVGVIDADYYNTENDGHIKIPLYNFTNKIVEVKKGERVAQGIFTTYNKTRDDNGNNTVRLGGFGSSGK